MESNIPSRYTLDFYDSDVFLFRIEASFIPDYTNHFIDSFGGVWRILETSIFPNSATVIVSVEKETIH